MKAQPLLLTVFLCLTVTITGATVSAQGDDGKKSQPQRREKPEKIPGEKTIYVSKLLYMGKYWIGAKATYSITDDAITLVDRTQERTVQWETAPPALKASFLEFRGMELMKLAEKADVVEQKTGDNLRVSGTVVFVVDEGVLIERKGKIILVEGVTGLADGEVYSGRARRTNRVYRYLLDHGRVATKRVYEQVPREIVETTETTRAAD